MTVVAERDGELTTFEKLSMLEEISKFVTENQTVIDNTYPIKSNRDKTAFLFESTGPRGTILKFVLLEDLDDRFNLAFGDVLEGELTDSVTSNNQDIVKILNTVAMCVYEFLKENTGALIEITPYDDKRKRLYNSIFQRKYQEIEVNFEITAVVGAIVQKYDPTKTYDYFLLKHKI